MYLLVELRKGFDNVQHKKQFIFTLGRNKEDVYIQQDNNQQKSENIFHVKEQQLQGCSVLSI